MTATKQATERKVATVARHVQVDGVELAVHVPVSIGSPPTEIAKLTMNALQELGNWKRAIRPFYTFDRKDAEDLAYCLNWFCGGHEWEEITTQRGTLYRVSSKGYYHYIGA